MRRQGAQRRTTSIEDALVDHVRRLPPSKQREVLDFAAFLRKRKAPKRRPRTLAGLWKGLDVTPEEIDQARQEMWGTFPREDA